MPASLEPAPLDLGDLLRVAGRRKLLLMVPWLAAILIGVAAALLLPSVYFSNTSLLLERPQSLSSSLSGMVNPISPERQAEVMRDQVQSSSFLRGVLAATGLATEPETRAWALHEAARFPGGTADERIEAFLVDHMRDAITIRKGRGNVFQVTVEDQRADRARRIAESVANQFVISSKAAQLEAVRATQEFSVEQQQVYKRKLEDSEARLDRVKRGILTTTLSGSSVNEVNLGRARTLLDQTDLDLEDQRQRIVTLRQQISDPSRDQDAAMLTSTETTSMTAQIKGLERQIAAAQLLNEAGGDNGAARVASARKINDLEMQFTQNAALKLPNASPELRDALVRLRLADVDLQAKGARRAYLASQVGAYEQHVVLTPDREADVRKLEQEVENNRAFYNSFLQQSAAAQIAEAFENAKVSGHFVVLEPANLPRAPGKPNRPVLLLLSIVLGGVVGIGSVLLAERHDQSMKNADEVETLLGLPVIGAIPRVDELQRSRRRARRAAGPGEAREGGLLHRLKVETPLGLEFRRIYLKLAKARARPLPSTIVITSSTRGEGKTTTSACLGITFARELTGKVLLVDFDLRSPALHRALGLPSSSWGLAQMLGHQGFDERFIRSTVLPNLDFLAAGKSERPASELVNSDSVEWFIREARARYPLVLIDSAPNLAVPDPLILGRAVEGVLYVIKAGQTVRKAAEYGVKVQREACDNILGVLMNDAGEILPHYYGYHDAYGYTSEVAGGES
jgi:succinoglycan biosynthesis transport protein ExoP